MDREQPAKRRHHVIISGTGRAGTTFLVQLLTRLGLDTGFQDPSQRIYENCDAGMELDIRRADSPYVVKSPWLCDYLDDVLSEGSIVVDHAIVPMRDLYAAAESRRDVARRSDATVFPADNVPGGLWHTAQPEHQERILAEQLYKLVLTLAKFSVPTTLLYFPRLTTDAEYVYRLLSPLLRNIAYVEFEECFREVSRPELVHHFRKDQRSEPS